MNEACTAGVARLVGALALSATLAGCAGLAGPAAPARPGQPAAPSLGLFSRIGAPEGAQPVLQLAARGTQIFRCEQDDKGWFWAFRQPEAELFDAAGKAVGRHGVNFSFEHVDGSRLAGTVKAFDAAPDKANLPWLLISTRPFGKGAFEGVTVVQRVNTSGGLPPPACEAARAGQVLRVPFGADFVFYRAGVG